MILTFEDFVINIQKDEKEKNEEREKPRVLFLSPKGLRKFLLYIVMF